MIRFTYPKSFLSLLLIGFSIVAAPLVFALFTNVMAFEKLAAISEQAVHSAVRVTQASRSLLPAISKKNPARTAESRITMQTFYLAIGMRKDEPKLKEWVNGWVTGNLQNGKLGAIYKKYHGVDIPVEQLLKAAN